MEMHLGQHTIQQCGNHQPPHNTSCTLDAAGNATKKGTPSSALNCLARPKAAISAAAVQALLLPSCAFSAWPEPLPLLPPAAAP